MYFLIHYFQWVLVRRNEIIFKKKIKVLFNSVFLFRLQSSGKIQI